MVVICKVEKSQKGKIWACKPQPENKYGCLFEIISRGKIDRDINSFRKISINRSSNILAAFDSANNLFIFDLVSNRYYHALTSTSKFTALHVDQDKIITGCDDASLKIIGIHTGKEIVTFRGHKAAIHSIRAHKTGLFAVSVSSDCACFLDLNSFSNSRRINIEGDEELIDVMFLNNWWIILAIFRDNSIQGISVEDGKVNFRLPTEHVKDSVFKHYVVSKDGKLLAVCGKSQTAYLFSLETHEQIYTTKGRSGTIIGLHFAEWKINDVNSQFLLLFKTGDEITLLNTSLWEEKTLENVFGHKSVMQSISLSPHLLCSLTYSGSILIFDFKKTVLKLKKLLKFEQTPKIVSKARISPKRNPKGAPKRQKESLSRDKLRLLLKPYNAYPSKYRLFIWKKLLRLPENYEAYSKLAEKGVHDSFKEIEKHFPIKNGKLLRIFKKVMSAIAHWSPVLASSEFVPHIAFPFVILFQNNHMTCFEAVVTVLVNWCSSWFDFLPVAPINILGIVENLLMFHDKELIQHFVWNNITTEIYAWTLMRSFFTEVFTREQWIQFFDHVVSQEPEFLLFCVISYCIISRRPLLNMYQRGDFMAYFQQQREIDVTRVISEAQKASDITPSDIHPRGFFKPFSPLSVGNYQKLDINPQAVIDYNNKEKNRIQNEGFKCNGEDQVTTDEQSEEEDVSIGKLLNSFAFHRERFDAQNAGLMEISQLRQRFIDDNNQYNINQ